VIALQDVYMISGVRTAIGVFGGALKGVPAHHMAAAVLKEAVSRAGITPEQVDEVVLGEVRNSEVSNMGRVALLMAGFPEATPGATVNRLCASSLEATRLAFHAIQTGSCDVMVAGGVESMSRAPVYVNGDRFGSEPLSLVNSSLDSSRSSVPAERYGRNLAMTITAQNVADRYEIGREDQDVFALQSQNRAAKAIETGVFQEEIVPLEYKAGKEMRIFSVDEGPRGGLTMEKLARLKPLFEGGSVTAGNACGRNDGASAIVLMSGDKVRELGVKPICKLTAITASGVSPEIMGIGPVSAVEKLWKKTGFAMEDIDLVELNEAFASQSLACIRALGMDQEKVNVNGGAIALGHPLGSTGTRLLVTLGYEMRRRGAKRGLAALCVGGGQGMAALVEEPNI